MLGASKPVQISWAPQTPGHGQLAITMDGYRKTLSYGENDTAVSIASAIGASLSLDTASPVWARGDLDGSVTMRLRKSATSGLFICLTPDGGSGCPVIAGVQITTDSTAILPPLTPSLSLSCSPNPVQTGSAVTCYTQSPAGATGDVSIYLGNSLLFSGKPDPSGVTTAHTTAPQSEGSYAVTASYMKSLFYPAATSSSTFSVRDGGGGGDGGKVPADGTELYSYQVSSYAGNGNVLAYTDSVNGQWTAGYDPLNRIKSASQTKTNGQQQKFCWQYDSFGNRLQQAVSDQPFGADCQAQAGASLDLLKLAYDSSNRIKPANGYRYDDAGNVIDDGQQEYLYDGDGQMCASRSKATPSYITGYLYDALGQRIAKGTPAAWSCDPDGFQITNEYVTGPGGEQVSELDGNGNLLHTNVHANGRLIASYDGNAAVHYQFTDWLGTLRRQVSATGVTEQTCTGGAFGYRLDCYGSNSSTDLRFTGKEHDNESNLDYFGARYLSSATGRWLSPDWSAQAEPVPYAKLDDPQSLNLYSYVLNNPLSSVDPDGHFDCSGENAGFIGCVTIANWNTDHEVTGAAWEKSGFSNVKVEKIDGVYTAQQQSGQPAPTNPDGSPKSPQGDVPNLPDGKGPSGGKVPNEWIPGQGSGQPGSRPVRWGPRYPIPGQSQPGASWDPDGHWDYDPGTKGGGRTRWLPNGGGQVDHDGNPMRSVFTWIGDHKRLVIGGAVVVGVGAAAILTGGAAAPALVLVFP